MTELRTTSHLNDSPQLVHTMATVGQQINPAIEVRTETFRKSVLISVRFPLKAELELFMAALAEKGVELAKWTEFEH